MNKTKKLFLLAENAKNNAEYDIANIVFCHLALKAQKGKNNLKMVVECDDPEYFLEDYYALLVLQGENGEYLNIPAPLVNREYLPDFFDEENVSFIDREYHDRVYTYDKTAEKLQEELSRLLTKKQINQAEKCLIKKDKNNPSIWGFTFQQDRKCYDDMVFFVQQMDEEFLIVSWRNKEQMLPKNSIVLHDKKGKLKKGLSKEVVDVYNDLKKQTGEYKEYHPTIALNLNCNEKQILESPGAYYFLVGTESSLKDEVLL